ncbi:MAG: hypothetical protein A3F12_02020 [Gammaproteobacteria bacterium RIFCSPHIGHO2_12_FULL_38_14]|nr:MAG: hypothetical protein A3F12_02020 [Gammaproteobacteria bacterium RIFCSPHIGHO2_12_FULL_38_14]
MSLTNDMLNNLEKRRSLNDESAVLFGGLEATASNKSYYFTYFLYFIAILVVIGALGRGFYLAWQHAKSPVVKPAPIIIKPAPVYFHIPKRQQPVIPVETPAPISIQDKAVLLYQAALAFIAQNQTSAAIEKLRDVIQIEPTYQDARVALATLYLENNLIVDAKQLLTDGLAIQPDNLQLTLLLARALTMQGHDHAALIALGSIADIAGNNSTYIELLASIQASLGHYADAIPLYQALLHQDPSNDRWLVGLAVADEHIGQNAAALTAYQKANATGQLPLNLQSFVTDRMRALGGQ